MVCLKYPISLISKLNSGLWVSPDNMFSYENIFLIWGIQQVLFFTLFCSVFIKNRVLSSAVLVWHDVDKRKKIAR